MHGLQLWLIMAGSRGGEHSQELNDQCHDIQHSTTHKYPLPLPWKIPVSSLFVHASPHAFDISIMSQKSYSLHTTAATVICLYSARGVTPGPISSQKVKNIKVKLKVQSPLQRWRTCLSAVVDKGISSIIRNWHDICMENHVLPVPWLLRLFAPAPTIVVKVVVLHACQVGHNMDFTLLFCIPHM